MADPGAPPSQGTEAKARRQTLPRAGRLRRRAEFQAAQTRGRKLHTESFLVFILPRPAPAPSAEPARLGITVSKKVGNAVTRNRVKRLVREAFRRRRTLFPEGHDVVFVAKKQAAEVTFDRVVDEMEGLCRRHLRRR